MIRAGQLLLLLAALEAPGASAAPATQPGPVAPDLPDDPTVWPNRTGYRKSELWLVANHARLKAARPRVLVLNFANDVGLPGIQARTEKFIKAVAEATRYHGYEDARAPAFIQYEVAKYVDLRDQPPPPESPPEAPARAHKTSTLFPRLAPRPPHYDGQGRPRPGVHGPAGNGGDKRTLPWSGRSFAVYFFNPQGGTGCQVENFGHLLEGYANHDAIASHTPYFSEYAGLDLDQRYAAPFASLYAAVAYTAKNAVSYPAPAALAVKSGAREYRLAPYVAAGGNVHFPPGARQHYDLSSPQAVRSTIHDCRRRNGPDGRDRVGTFNIEMTRRYRELAPDGMGQWVVYWGQNMPGLGNQCRDDAGAGMKNWWVYLLY